MMLGNYTIQYIYITKLNVNDLKLFCSLSKIIMSTIPERVNEASVRRECNYNDQK